MSSEERLDAICSRLDDKLDGISGASLMHAPDCASAELFAVELLTLRSLALGVRSFDWKAWCNAKYPDVAGPVRCIAGAMEQLGAEEFEAELAQMIHAERDEQDRLARLEPGDPESDSRWIEDFRELVRRDPERAIGEIGSVWMKRAGRSEKLFARNDVDGPNKIVKTDRIDGNPTIASLTEDQLVELVVTARRDAYENPVSVGSAPEELHRAALAISNAKWELIVAGDSTDELQDIHTRLCLFANRY